MPWHEAETWIEEAGKRDTPLLVLEFLLHANLCDEYNLSSGTGTGTVATAFFKFFLSSAQPTKQEKTAMCNQQCILGDLNFQMVKGGQTFCIRVRKALN